MKGNARDQKCCNKQKNAFYELISGLDTAEERIIELEDMSVETSQTEMQRGEKE